jgi:hypothetical protein
MPLFEDLVRRALAAKERAVSLSRESRRIGALAEAMREAHRGRRVLKRCARCGRFEVGGEWLRLEAIDEGQHEIAAVLLAHAKHGICEDCREAELGRSKTRREDIRW